MPKLTSQTSKRENVTPTPTGSGAGGALRGATGRRKRVEVICHGPIAVGPHYKSPWEDIWLRWKAKPGRKKYFLGPVLECEAELIADIEMDKEVYAEHPEFNMGEEIAESEATLSKLHATFRVAEPNDPNGTPSVYTKANGIDRKEAERMLTLLLSQNHGINRPKFLWRKLEASNCIMPASFGKYE